MDKSLQDIYGNRVRIRTCGLCFKENKLLLVNHFGLYNHDFWAPPGGGVEFGMAAEGNLEKEFLEETGLVVRTGDFLFACEFIHPPFHALELFFEVTALDGNIKTGTDPEMGVGKQIIKEVRFLSEIEIALIPEKGKHGMFKVASSMEKIRALRGYWKI